NPERQNLFGLETWYSVLGTPYLVLRTWYSVLGTPYLVLRTWYSVLGTPYLVLGTSSSLFSADALHPDENLFTEFGSEGAADEPLAVRRRHNIHHPSHEKGK